MMLSGDHQLKEYNMKKENESLLTQDEVSNMLDLAVPTLRKWRWEGKGPKFVKLGGRILYRESDIWAYINENVKSSTSE